MTNGGWGKQFKKCLNPTWHPHNLQYVASTELKCLSRTDQSLIKAHYTTFWGYVNVVKYFSFVVLVTIHLLKSPDLGQCIGKCASAYSRWSNFKHDLSKEMMGEKPVMDMQGNLSRAGVSFKVNWSIYNVFLLSKWIMDKTEFIATKFKTI